MIAEDGAEKVLMDRPAEDGDARCDHPGHHDRAGEHHPPFGAARKVKQENDWVVLDGREQSEARPGPGSPAAEIGVVARDAREGDEDVRLAEAQRVDEAIAREQYEYRGIEQAPGEDPRQ